MGFESGTRRGALPALLVTPRPQSPPLAPPGALLFGPGTTLPRGRVPRWPHTSGRPIPHAHTPCLSFPASVQSRRRGPYPSTQTRTAHGRHSGPRPAAPGLHVAVHVYGLAGNPRPRPPSIPGTRGTPLPTRRLPLPPPATSSSPTHGGHGQGAVLTCHGIRGLRVPKVEPLERVIRAGAATGQ